jgi:hypothetical protein
LPKLAFFKGFGGLGGQSASLGNLGGPFGEKVVVWMAKLYLFLFFLPKINK